MKILLLGKNGQVGWELQRALVPLGELIAIERNSQDYCGDLTNPKMLAETIRIIKPNIIVNAAAYTAVDKAESEPKIAELINSESIKVLAQEAQKLGAWLIHYSTDYVFSGDGQIPWSETDKKAPLSIYGSTKSNGEDQIQKYCSNYLIFRTSWVYSTHGNNFAKTILRLSHERQSLSIINDQFGAPTSAELIADCTAHAIKIALQKPNVSGLYHLVASGFTNWFEYAQLVIDKAKEQKLTLLVEKLVGIPAAEYPLPAKRPYNSRMDNNKFKNTFNITLPDWKLGVIRMVTELTNK